MRVRIGESVCECVRTYTAHDGVTLHMTVAPVHPFRQGWLKTVDQYFTGSNNTIQNADVRTILSSVLLSLASNPARKFTYDPAGYVLHFLPALSIPARPSTRPPPCMPVRQIAAQIPHVTIIPTSFSGPFARFSMRRHAPACVGMRPGTKTSPFVSPFKLI